MKEKVRNYLLSLGYSEAEVEETLANATEEDLKGLVPEVEAPKARAKPTRAKAKPVKKTSVKAPSNVTVVPFDPVSAAMSVIEKAPPVDVEDKNVVKYTITPVYKLTICSEVNKETFNAIKEELKSVGGKWSDEIGGFWFDQDPSNLF